MPSFAKLCAVVVIGSSLALAACGSSKPATGASSVTSVNAGANAGSVDLVGTLDGRSFVWQDVASAVVTTGSTQQFVVVVSDAANVCDAIGNGSAKNANLLLVSVTEEAGTVNPGTHIVSGASGAVAGEQVTIAQVSAGATLAATSGQVAVSYIATDNSVPAVLVLSGASGVYNLSGSLEAPYCAALAKDASAY